MEEHDAYYLDTDLDLSFTSTTTDQTFTSSSARSSLTRSSLTLSFNNRLSTSHLHHRRSDPHWTSIKAATTLSSDHRLHLRHLGRVFLCHLRDDYPNSNGFALKVIDRDSLTTKTISNVETESEILSLLDHPFLPTLYARIDASHYTCLLTDYCSNGDLHSLLRKQPNHRFTISPARFFAAEVLVALEYLHALGIVYRDLKPENILIREDGHVMLSDFDLCFRRFSSSSGRRRNRSRGGCFSTGEEEECEREEVVAEFTAEPVDAFWKSCVGTHEYLAPEIVAGNGHGSGVDWWGVWGVSIRNVTRNDAV